jgi:hypothetical protein
MFVFVPQGFVALVFADGKQIAVLEPGVGFVQLPAGNFEVQYVDLQPRPRAGDLQPEALPDDWFV